MANILCFMATQKNIDINYMKKKLLDSCSEDIRLLPWTKRIRYEILNDWSENYLAAQNLRINLFPPLPPTEAEIVSLSNKTRLTDKNKTLTVQAAFRELSFEKARAMDLKN